MIERAGFHELAVEGVRFAFSAKGPAVVDGVSLRAGPEEFVAIVGPNGSGKSTLLRLLVGELRASEGRIVLDGEAMAGHTLIAAARRVALVPQQGTTGGWGGGAFGYTVREMVLMARHAANARAGLAARLLDVGFETGEDLQLANAAMWDADVHHLADRAFDTLSGGERQRVAIARAFTQETPIVLLDEPTAALDLHHELELVERLRKATREEGRLAVVVTHDLNFAAAHATRVVVMDQGRVVADASPRAALAPGILEEVYRVKVRVDAEGMLRFARREASL